VESSTETDRAPESLIVNLSNQIWLEGKITTLCSAVVEIANRKIVWFGHGNGTISLWDPIKNYQPIKIISIYDKAKRIYSITLVNNTIWIGGDNTTIEVLDATGSESEKIFCLVGHDNLIRSIIFDGNNVYSLDARGILHVWNVKDYQIIYTYNLENEGMVRCMACIPKNYIWVGVQNQIIIINTKSKTIVRKSQAHKKKINAILPVGEEIWTAADEPFIINWIQIETEDSVALKLVRKIDSGCDRINSMCVALEKQYVFAGAFGQIMVWRIQNHSLVATLSGIHKDLVHCLQPIEPHSVWSGASSLDGSICVWFASRQTES